MPLVTENDTYLIDGWISTTSEVNFSESLEFGITEILELIDILGLTKLLLGLLDEIV